MKRTPRRMVPILLLAICLTQNAFAKDILVTPPPSNVDALGDPFHLRNDAGHYQRGCRLKATLRIVDRHAETAEVLHQLAPAIWSRQVLPIVYR